ncbi:hypothetical protein [Neomoorella glycerini]|uniref:hypothetical protein n=1 Tax=Neomoorella glycerini TaxID=55779 RepID=UPI001B8C1F2C|nr:hypothetical protein [Moorella glycerini]
MTVANFLASTMTPSPKKKISQKYSFAVPWFGIKHLEPGHPKPFPGPLNLITKFSNACFPGFLAQDGDNQALQVDKILST